MTRNLVRIFFALALSLPLLSQHAAAQTLATNVVVATNSVWRFQRGTNEASSPIDAWRLPGYDDSAWSLLPAPFHYGTNSVGGDDTLTDGTILSDMQGSYSTVFIRRKFVVSNAAAATGILLRMNIDDACVAWLNGVEIRRFGTANSTPGTPVYYTNSASSSREAVTAVSGANSGSQTNLVEGTNVICFQGFNYGATNEDFRIDPEIYLISGTPPVLTNIFPAPGANVTNLSQITVWFNHSVSNVNASDLRINNQPATGLIGGVFTNVFTFTFVPPPTGVAQVTWDPQHGIRNSIGVFYSADTWAYASVSTPPLVQSVSPAPGSTVDNFTQLAVTFNQAVTNVDGSDLLVNGQPASQATAFGNTYTFFFTRPAVGNIQVAWDPQHNIASTIGIPFDGSANVWTFNMPLNTVTVTPAPGATLASVTEVQVTFNDPVTGVDAADLLINGQPAASVFGSGAGPYIFNFPSPPAGQVQFSWAVGHGIRDAATPSYSFAGGSWTITLDPASFTGDVIINEILAGNSASNSVYDVDEDRDISDWIELYNRGSNAVRLLGWSLTDTKSVPGQWTFPDVTIGPGKYLLVYASAKDRTVVGGTNSLGRTNQLHTNFKMNVFGEYLGLYDASSPKQVISEFNPGFPEQRNDYSYGLTPTNGWRYFFPPTPLAPNGDSPITQVVPMPHVNVSRGVFDQPFTLVASCDLPDATLIYTTNGSAPSIINGQTYTNRLTVSGTTIFRIAAFRTNMLPSRVSTHTYLFYDQVLRQPNNPPGYPATWVTQGGTSYPADYEMDPEVVTNAAYANLVKPALNALPALSVVLKIEDMFSQTNGIYANPEPADAVRYLWERACSAEFMPTNDEPGFHVDCGIRIQGNASRTPSKTSKHPMRLLFKGDYGPGQLEYQIYPDSPVNAWDSIVLRADFNNSWLHWDTSQRTRGTRLRDAWGKDTFRAMGAIGGHSRYFNLFINGLYWGVYEFSERIDKTFASNYAGGSPDDYDVMASKPTEALDGDRIAYDTMVANVRSKDMRSLLNYSNALGYVDMTNFCDYMLLEFYAANQDWGFDGNWNAFRRRAPGALYEYCIWDAERFIEQPTDNRVSNTDVPSGLHTNLINSAEYKLFFADRVQKHLFNNGALTTNQCIPRLLNRANQLDTAIIAESARWGDNRRDVMTTQGGGTAPFYLYDRNNVFTNVTCAWLPEINRLITSYFPQRSANFLTQLRAAGLYPAITAPTFSQHGGRVPANYSLAITGVTDAVYYTTNGADPRVFGSGAVAASARIYPGPLTIGSSVTVKARALNQGTNWSALVEATFVVDTLIPTLRITEIMYNPVAGSISGDAFEYIELQNVGAVALDLTTYSIKSERQSGIAFTFPVGFTILPGQRIVLGSSLNTNAFKVRYPGVTVAGWFDGNLSNGGEKISILDKSLRTVLSVDYDDENGWPTAPDGGGYSLEIINPNGDPDDPANWRASAVQNGTPGQANAAPPVSSVVLNEVMADNVTFLNTNGVYPDWVELYNGGATATNIANWSLSDDGLVRKFVFPPNTIIPAGGYLVVWCDTQTNAPGLHTGFALSRLEDNLFLYDQTATRVDGVSWGPQVADAAIGRVNGTWTLTAPTLGSANTAVALGSSSAISINEWMANPVPGSDDWIELFNTSSSPVALQNLLLGTSNALFQVRSLSFVAPGGYLQLFADENPGANHVDFRLPSTGGAIVLYDRNGAELQRVTYGAQIEGVSQGRLPDGTSTIVSFPGSASPAASNYVSNYTGPFVNEVLARNASLYGPFGDSPDFVEIYNPAASPFSLGGFGLSDSAGKVKFRFGPAVSIAANGYLVVWCDSGRADLTNGPLFNASFAISGDGGGVYLFNPLGQVVNSVSYGIQVSDLPIGLSGGQWRLLASATPGAANAAPAALGSITNLAINEWMANPAGGDDWFEVFNRDLLPVSLAGLYLTDDPSVFGLSNSVVAPLSFIGGRSWTKFVADGNRSAGADHVNFSLDGTGETLRIYSPSFAIIDSVSFGALSNGVSQGRLPDGGSNIVSFPTTPTPAAANYLPHAGVVISEVLTHTDLPLEDAIELQNIGSNTVTIGDWWISNSERNLAKYRVPSGTTLAPGQFIVFYENQFNPDGTGADPSFTLNSAHGDSVYVSETDGAGNLTGYRAQVSFGAAQNGVSFGRFPTSVGADFTAMAQRTFGVDNPSTVTQFRTGTGRTNSYAAVGPVIINEINYHPVNGLTLAEDPNEEFIELQNNSASAVPLFDPANPTNTWRLSGGIQLAFPTNLTLASGAYLVVVAFDPVANPTASNTFRARFATTANLVGPFSGRLANEGDVLELYKPDAPQAAPHPDAGFVPYVLVDRVAYSDVAPWPTGADGGGASLQRRGMALYGNDPVNWTNFVATAGSTNSGTGSQSPLISGQPQNLTVVQGGTAVFSVAASGTPAPAYQWQHAGTNLPGATSSTLTISNVQPAHAGAYRALVSNIAGTLSSVSATLTVIAPPLIVQQPQSQSAVVGHSAQLSVVVSGTAPLYYQWRKDNSEIPGANNPQLTFGLVGVSDGGNYTVVITNVAGSVTSSVATVSIIVPPTITADPVDRTVLVNSSVTFTVSASGTAPFTYQWLKNGTNIPATGPALSFASVQASDAGNYSVVVSNAGGSATSASARLIVSLSPIAPSLGAPHALADKTFTFSLTGLTNQTYFIEWSANLVTWSNLGSVTLTNSPSTVLDPSASNAPIRFYRVRQ